MAGARVRRPLLSVVAACAVVFLIAGFYHREAQLTLESTLQSSSGSGLSLAQVEPLLMQDAHQLRSADDFLPHLKAVVTQLPGLDVEGAKSTCQWPPGGKVNFQFDPPANWIAQDRSSEEIELRRLEWHRFIAEGGLIPYTKVRRRLSGRGLVIVAGNGNTLMRVMVVLRSLVRLKSTIAVEVHYWADEMGEEQKRDLVSIYTHIQFNDLSGPHNLLKVKKDGFFGINYQLKTAALVNSNFAEPLLLDSDNIPVIDPALLYDSATYREYGTVFWPDIARTRPNNPAWAIFNTKCRMDEYEQESGQLLVDKTRFWYHLQLAAWMNNDQGIYYGDFLLGDKDTFRFAWHALKTSYGKPKNWLTSVGTFNDGVYCGHSFAQHHPDDSRIAFMHGGLLKTVDLEVMRWNRDVHGGYFRHYKRAPSDQDAATNVHVGITFDPAVYVGREVRPAMCTDMFDVEARDLDEILPGFEQIFQDLGGYWMLDKPKDE